MYVFFPMPINSSTLQMPTGYPTIKFNYDTNYPEVMQTLQNKDSDHKLVPTSNTKGKFQASHISDQAVINQRFPIMSPWI